MIDPGEAIREYVFGLIRTISGVTSTWRNRANLAETDPQTGAALRPAIVMLDGDMENIIPNQAFLNTKAVKMVPTISKISPEFVILLDAPGTRANTTDQFGDPYNPGAELSFWHFQIKAAIENDPGLVSLLTPTGQIIWAGFETTLTARRFGPRSPVVGVVHYDLYFPLPPPRS